jgi:hypothetical protein
VADRRPCHDLAEHFAQPADIGSPHRVGARRYVAAMSNAAPWASTASNKFRQVARESTNSSTKLLAEGLTPLAEAMRELDSKLESIERQMRSTA